MGGGGGAQERRPRFACYVLARRRRQAYVEIPSNVATRHGENAEVHTTPEACTGA